MAGADARRHPGDRLQAVLEGFLVQAGAAVRLVEREIARHLDIHVDLVPLLDPVQVHVVSRCS